MMAIVALFLGLLGGACGIVGIISAFKGTVGGANFTPAFWLTLAIVLLLGCIASLLSRTGENY